MNDQRIEVQKPPPLSADELVPQHGFSLHDNFIKAQASIFKKHPMPII